MGGSVWSQTGAGVDSSIGIFAADPVPLTLEPQAFTPQILALIGGTEFFRWNVGMPLGTPTFVTFSFMNQVLGYDSAAARPGFQAFTFDQKMAARSALSGWSQATGITFLEVNNMTDADVLFGMHDFTSTANSGFSGYAYYPSISPSSLMQSSIGGDIWLNSATFSGNSLGSGWGYHVLLHEIGHAIGLKHPFDGTPTLPAGEDNTNNTVMSYTGGAQSGPRLYDVSAAAYLYGTSDYSYFWDWPNSTLTIQGGASSDNILGIHLNDVIIAGGGNDSVLGLSGNDWIFGGADSDILRGGSGNDVLYGDLFASDVGSDNLTGDSGNDILIGGALLDIADGGDGDDWIFGSDGGDMIIGGSGNDVAYGDLFAGEFGTDNIQGGDGADTLIGGAGDDVIYGSTSAGFTNGLDGADWLFGSDGNDQLYGNNGNDTLFGDLFAGESGADLLMGEAGDDWLWGGPGNDILNGGNGSDVYYTGLGMDVIRISFVSEVRNEIVYDFSAGIGGDIVDLRGAYASGLTFATFYANNVRQSGGDTVIDFDGAGSLNELTMLGVARAQIASANFIF
jgi:Ca2+-binding RTX toxin-like protein